MKDQFEFLNSPIFLKYTQESYRTLEETKYRLTQTGSASRKWKEMEQSILAFRKTGAIPLFLSSIDKKFWFYPADCILRKAHEIEKAGLALHERIVQNSSFSNEFLMDATIEEAITSAIYEGANSTRAKAQELIQTEAAPTSKDDWMILNNFNAMMWIKKNKNREVSKNLIREIHEIVTKNTLTDDDVNYSGKFRDDKVYVMSRRNEIKHEGVDFKLLETALDEAIQMTTKHPRYFPSLLKGILFHYFVAFIHPFFDGNGRTARTLFYFKAMKNDLKFVEILSISAYLKNHGQQYEKAFEKVIDNHLDATYFIDFNLDALKKALDVVQSKVDFLVRIGTLQEKKGLSENQIGFLQRMALNKFRKVDIEGYAKQIDKSREIARQELKQLAELNLLKEEKLSKKFVYSINAPVLESML